MIIIHLTLGYIELHDNDIVAPDNVSSVASFISFLCYGMDEVFSCGFSLWMRCQEKIDSIKLDNSVTCFHNFGGNIKDNMKVIIPNKHKINELSL